MKLKPLGDISLRCLFMIQVLETYPYGAPTWSYIGFPTGGPELVHYRKMDISPSSGIDTKPSNSPHVP